MLFPYTYVPHQIEKMQEFIDFIFFEVWCKAPISGPFDLNLFLASPELHEVMEAFYYSDTNGAEFFYGHVERIYQLFAVLNPGQIDQFKQWYDGNNDIESVCANQAAAHLARYTDIPAAYRDLNGQLASFFKGLYSQSLLDLAALKDKIGSIDDHYQSFVQANKVNKCPFCGISDLLGEYHSKREAYDHYLPKTLYPFNSMNLKNLAPACHHCNSSYKTSKNPAYSPKDPVGAVQRRKAFYPYRTNAQAIEIAVTIVGRDLGALSPQDIDLQFGPAELAEEIATWRDVYAIDERFRAKCCSGDAKDWVEQIRILRDSHHIEPDASLAALKEQTDKDRFANSNFLKEAFLDACKRAGLFNVMQG